MKTSPLVKSLLCASLAIAVSSCGGGGSGSTDSTPTPSPSNAPTPAPAPTPTPTPEPTPTPTPEPTPSPSLLPSVSVDINMRHVVGSIDTFDRRKYINIHASNTENDWWSGNAASRGAQNASDDLIGDFLDSYDVYLGRDTGGMAWQLSQIMEDPARPGYASESDASQRGTDQKWWYSNNPAADAEKARQYEYRATDMVVGAQQHPYWPDGKTTGQGWSFSTEDTPEAPFGTATGHYMGQFIAKYFNQGGEATGQPKPPFVEVMNEPLYDLIDDASTPTTPEKVFHFHNAVATEIRKTNPDVLIGGYTVAFPDFDKNEFERWEARDKAFIDIAGENMDFISLHLYDWANFGGTRQYRKGSNVEATFDMLESYMHLTLGEVKPFLISEFGAQVHSQINSPWTPYRDWEKINAMSAMWLSFMERPQMILKTIPFVVVKAEWGRVGDIPYSSRLMRQRFEAEGETGDEWVYTDQVKLYELWDSIQGTRVESHASEIDLAVDSYLDGNTLHVVINNLEMGPHEFTLNLHDLQSSDIASVRARQLYLGADNAPALSDESTSVLPETFSIEAEGTLMLELTLTEARTPSEEMEERKYYADRYKQAIVANTDIPIGIDGVSVGSHGEAILRLGLGRDHGKSLQPELYVNGQHIPVPEDYRGYDQYHNGAGRPNFFGVIEVPVPLSVLEESNDVLLRFEDTGGFVSTVTLQVFSSSTALSRTP